jgi:hypothetical protein
MAGIRLHAKDPLLRAGEGSTTTFVVELPLEFKLWKPGGRDRALAPCMTCGTPHRRKALHLRLDGNGDVIVAPDIYVSLLGSGVVGQVGSPLEVVNEVAEPPPLSIGAVDRDKERIVALPLNTDQTPETKVVPGSTKYEGEQRLWKPWVPIVDAAKERIDRIETKKTAERRRIFDMRKRKA